MPNPILNPRMNLSTRVKGRERLTPEPEHIADQHDVNAYRGLDVHMVDDVNDQEPPLPYDATQLVVYPDIPEDREPIPVKVVRDGLHDLSTFRVLRTSAGGTSALIAPRDAKRTSLAIANYGSVAVWIGDTSNVAVFTGWKVNPGVVLSMNTQSEVWAVSDDGTSQAVAVLVERSVPSGIPG